MGRGGAGVRRRLAELSERSSFRLNGVQRGSRIAMCTDKYGRWELGHKLGTLMRQTRDSVWVIWDNQPDFEVWSQGDARYEVERGRWRITAPRRQSPMDVIAGVRKLSPPESTDALTLVDGNGKMGISPLNSEGETEGRGTMSEQSTLSAKQVATKLGVDAKTFRRFLRSNACTVEPVGQGGRYEFGSKDIGSLKEQFAKWRDGKAPSASSTPATKRASSNGKAPEPPKRKKHKIDDDPLEIRLASTIAQRQQGAAMANAIEEQLEMDGMVDADLEPSDEELAELEDLDLEDLD